VITEKTLSIIKAEVEMIEAEENAKGIKTITLKLTPTDLEIITAIVALLSREASNALQEKFGDNMDSLAAKLMLAAKDIFDADPEPMVLASKVSNKDRN
jgi:hypothetical protein